MPRKVKACTSDTKWTTNKEIEFIFAMGNLKPVGINKHLYMDVITKRLSKALSKNVSSENNWSYLRTLYNLEELEKEEKLPFSNEQMEFKLDDDEYKYYKILSLKKVSLKKPSSAELSSDNNISLDGGLTEIVDSMGKL
ncbi:MRG/MORF4L-binding protein-like [Teleopsis dalmanni]|uniref:MRG/MORF4L-binding protein-like n=1 Tax=Teleopsis dalmanni TaxID=139649 RepID=UPI000D32C235|nr:MRG/MORF4L-binding protein-like [Teleopsis dalmanni]XP_037955536.1 MRG/MORF4L-binding protein-like [Teleopsis dalmanni]